MADMKWTQDQEKAIESTKGTVLVSAAAGSGKTAVLVERVIRILTDKENPCRADEMLIVTFTKAAAAQMKEKILNKLSAEIRENPQDTYLQKQKMLLSNANISTIDSFCNDVLKSNYHKTDFSRSGRFMDGSEKRSMMYDVYEDTVEKFYENNDEFFDELTGLYTSSGNDREFKEKMLSLYEFAQAYPFPDEWMDNIGYRFKNNSEKFLRVVINHIRKTLKYYSEKTDMLLSFLSDSDIEMDCYGASISDDLNFFRTASQKAQECLADTRKYDELMNFVLSHEFPPIGRKPRGYDSETLEEVRTVRKEYASVAGQKKIKAMFCSTSYENEQDIKQAYPLMKAASEFLKCFSKQFAQRKIENNCVDFSDVLHTAIAILVNKDENNNLVRTDVAKQYSEKFKYILVDEYQDTNYAQDMLFEAVSRNGENLFFVGDVKQSIYGFRQAMPQLFIEKREQFNSDVSLGYPANIYLGKNFRCRKGITDFVNLVFSNVMTKETCGIDYSDKEMFVCAADYPEKETNDVEIDCLALESDDMTQREKEAEFIACRIQKLLSSDEKISGDDGERNIRKGDICILLRSANANGKIYAKALAEKGIDCSFESNDSLFETTEIRTVLSLLKAIDNPLDDIALLSVMMSPIFAFNPDEIALIRLDGGKGDSLYKRVKFCAENGDEKCECFLDKLFSYRLHSGAMSADELIGRLIEDTGYESLVLSMKDGEARRNNLYLFRDYAKSLMSNSFPGLSAFLRLIEKIRQNGSEVPPSPKSLVQSDSVRIMSIHKSKGLEFPVCILAGCSGKINFTDCNNSMIIDHEYGAGLMGRDKERSIKYETVNHLALKIIKRQRIIEEEMRVLYVAMTRAKEKLIMCLSYKSFEDAHKKYSLGLQNRKLASYDTLSATCYADWISFAFEHIASQSPDGSFISAQTLNEENEKEENVFLKCGYVDTAFISRIEEVSQEDIIEVQAQPCEETVELIKEKTEYVYPYSSLNDIPSKMGAGDAHTKMNVEFFASSRPAFLDREGLTPAQKGTAMHLFMQHCDYLSAKNDLEKEIETVRKKNFLNDLEAASLDRKKLEVFFNSGLADRMFSSPEIYREKKFLINMSPSDLGMDAPDCAEDEKILVQGIIDCAFEENGQIVVIDYKTDRVSNEQELKDRYSHQLSIYKKAVEECFGKKVGATIIYSFYLSKEISLFD